MLVIVGKFFLDGGFCHISFGNLILVEGRWGDLLLGIILPLKIHEASGRYFLHCEEGILGRLGVVCKSVNLKGPWNKCVVAPNENRKLQESGVFWANSKTATRDPYHGTVMGPLLFVSRAIARANVSSEQEQGVGAGSKYFLNKNKNKGP